MNDLYLRPGRPAQAQDPAYEPLEPAPSQQCGGVARFRHPVEYGHRPKESIKMPRDETAWVSWLALPAEANWRRVKAHRDEPLSPGGRCRLTLFEAVEGGRPHPRFQISLPAATDPSPPGTLWIVSEKIEDVASFRAELAAQITSHQAVLAASELNKNTAPPGSERYWRASIAGQRRAAFFADVRAWLKSTARRWPKAERQRAQYTVAAAYDELLVATHRFDDADTGTYHGYGEDHPFVQVLEDLLATVPKPGSASFERLPPEQQASVRAQRRQCQAHLDHLMRHKYAFAGVKELDIERSVGGRLVDRERRQVVTSDLPKGSLVPDLALYRIPPDASHDQAGAWVYREGEVWRTRGGAPVDVEQAALRKTPLDAADVTFERAPRSALLRADIPLDWDRDGLLAPQGIGWIDWAGHCDLKAIQEALGLTLTQTPAPTVREHRTDTGKTHVFTRDRLLDGLTALMEFGSVYQPFDGSEDVVKGQTHFGGARNDALPDRIQFVGPGPGKSFRWPLERSAEAFTTTSLSGLDGESIDLDSAFQRWLPDADALTLKANPRYQSTVEGDYNVIDVSGHTLSFTARNHAFDATSGAYRREVQSLVVDLGQTAGRTLLGTHLQDAGARELYRVWLDHGRPAIIAELERWEQGPERWHAVPIPERNVVMPMVSPLRATLSREQKRDDPASFQALLEAALRRGEGIVADTDHDAPVWNGVVTQLDVSREASDESTRVERWRVGIKARFGRASLRWLIRRAKDGTPEAYAALDDSRSNSADFLWQDFPDVGSKARHRGTWLVNKAMVSRGAVEIRRDETVDGGVYVHDEHIKNLAEILWCGLAGHGYTIVHGNKRFVFDSEAAWKKAIKEADRRRDLLAPASAVS